MGKFCFSRFSLWRKWTLPPLSFTDPRFCGLAPVLLFVKQVVEFLPLSPILNFSLVNPHSKCLCTYSKNWLFLLFALPDQTSMFISPLRRKDSKFEDSINMIANCGNCTALIIILCYHIITQGVVFMYCGIESKRLTLYSPFSYCVEIAACMQCIKHWKVHLPFQIPGKRHWCYITSAHKSLSDRVNTVVYMNWHRCVLFRCYYARPNLLANHILSGRRKLAINLGG